MSRAPLTIAEVLRRHADRGDKALLVCDAERLSYADAERLSASLAGRLVGLGVGKGTHVGVLHPNGARFVVAMLAVTRIGAVAVPFSTFSTATELGAQLVDSDVTVLLATRSYRSHDYVTRLSEVLSVPPDRPGPLYSTAAPVLRHIVFTEDAPYPAPTPADDEVLSGLEDDVDGDDVLAIIYTSGSTGTPKGVVHTHAGLLAHQHSLNDIRRLTLADKLFCNSPFFWIGGFAFGLLATLTAGATLICSDATDASETLDLLEAEKPTLTNGFVAGIAHLTRHPSFAGRDLQSIRRGNLYPIMAPDTRPADPELRHNMLGMTEAGSVLLLSGDDTDQPEARRGSYGALAPGFEARIIDLRTGGDVEAGTVGELLIRGPHMMQGYYGRSREECFDPDGWFHTGDLVRRDADGFYYFLGRAGSMIKTSGANVAPAEVEKALTETLKASHPDVTAHVVGLPDAERGQIVAAVVATDAGLALDDSALRHQLRASLSAFKIPRRFLVVRHDDLPMLSSGKIDVPGLQRLFDD
ncbi:Long-chain-fatty-acid--CoA ligase [Mycolicibacterium vanbaalenii]|uniref:Long-chain-fatty-acid--CoA ligase n=1 Tax=Mycolicibacterium vanbaalenii TaxID=110539 RepID=A0A5S9NVH9_MYCVN|nr:class I adenylate-forming enzyme family protein [Mycolicibacterium vanbaalenii]CAA0094741.1 Long-chain-fatty-acid--CoA ligase [Mycolicibacterium vanbaalenii]